MYKAQDILQFPEIYCLEKLHGTSAHIKCRKNKETEYYELSFFSGGEKYQTFVDLFDKDTLLKLLSSFERNEIILFGECYGGKMQGMRATYGDETRFTVFDAQIDGVWLTVPNAEHLAKFCKLEYVHYVKIKTSIEAIDAERDADSIQAIRNGMGEGKKREGVVLRPLEEFIDERENRIIAKHKRDDFQETRTPRSITKEEQKVLSDAEEIAVEWVTPMRFQHVLDQAKNAVNFTNAMPGMCQTELGESDTGTFIKMMLTDIETEAKGEIVESREARKAIGRKTAKLYKEWLNNRLKENKNASI